MAAMVQWRAWACWRGAITHLIWDAFTHEGGRGVRMFPVLDDSLIDIGNRHIPAMYVLQDLGSIIGLAAVLAMLCWGLRRGHDAPLPNRLLAEPRARDVVADLRAGGRGLLGRFYVWQDSDSRPRTTMSCESPGQHCQRARPRGRAALR